MNWRRSGVQASRAMPEYPASNPANANFSLSENLNVNDQHTKQSTQHLVPPVTTTSTQEKIKRRFESLRQARSAPIAE